MLVVANINGMADFSAIHANFVGATTGGGGRRTTMATTIVLAIGSEINNKVLEWNWFLVSYC